MTGSGYIRHHFNSIKELMDYLALPVERIILPCNRGFTLMERRQVLWIQSDGNYSWAHYGDGRKSLLSSMLKHMESKLLSADFYRIHHQYLVNLHHLLRYEKRNGGWVVLSDGTTLPVSRSRKPLFLLKIRQFH